MRNTLRYLLWLAVPAVILFDSGRAHAVDESYPMKQLDRSKLSESFRNTGEAGATFALGSEGYIGRENASMMYPFTFHGAQGDGNFGGRNEDNDCSKGDGVWILAKDAAGNHYITSSGPVSNSRDVVPVAPDLSPGGNLKLSNGQDNPYTQIGIGYNTKKANVWFNSDDPLGILQQTHPISNEPVRIDNYREDGKYTLPKFDSFPEETVITKWTSDVARDPTGTGMTMTRYAYAWSNQDFDDFYIVELEVENTSNRDYPEVYIGQMNFFSISKPGHSWRKWNGYWSYGSNQWPVEDDRYQFTEASNYAGNYRGEKVSYQYDGDSPRSTEIDEGEPYISALAETPVTYRAEGELVSPQYIGWGAVDLVPPYVNDPETYVPITGTTAGGPDIPQNQPAYSHWWLRRSRTNIEFEPNETIDTVDGMWNKIITPGKPYDDNPTEGGPRPGERELIEPVHTQMFGPWHLKPGDKAKIVLVFAAGYGGEYAGAGGEPMDFRLWAMSPGAKGQLKDGERALFNHIERGRLLYEMGYDLPNQPPDVPSLGRTDTNRPLKITSNAEGHAQMTWTDGADGATNPDYTGSEASDIAGYRIYSTTGLQQTDPVPHAGSIGGPWQVIADIPVKDPAYYKDGVYTFVDQNSITGYPYWYNIVPYAKGHDHWENLNAQQNVLAGAQAPKAVTLADLPEIVQKHVEKGLEASHIVDAARSRTDGNSFTPVVAASDSFDALEKKVLVVPNPWKDDGVHSFGALGDNNKRMRFTNLPRLARISIYTAAGDLVVQIVHDGTGNDPNVGEVSWSQQARSGTSLAAPGIYFFAVESLVPGYIGKVQTGSFLIIE